MGICAKQFLSLPIGFEAIEDSEKLYLYHGTEFVACFSIYTDFALVQVFVDKWVKNYEGR